MLGMRHLIYCVIFRVGMDFHFRVARHLEYNWADGFAPQVIFGVGYGESRNLQ